MFEFWGNCEMFLEVFFNNTLAILRREDGEAGGYCPMIRKI